MLVSGLTPGEREMTEYELLDLVGTWKADTVSVATSFVSILFAYILVAYVAGAKLTRGQFVIVTVLMLWHCSINLFQIQVNQQSLIEYHELIRPEWSAAAVRNGLIMKWVIGSGGVMSIFAALYFMWSVRHPKAE